MSELGITRTRSPRPHRRGGDEAALEAARVDLLGKKGSISEALKTLGAMSPDERKVKGPIINGMRDRVTAALAERKSALGDAALEAKLADRARRRHAARAARKCKAASTR